MDLGMIEVPLWKDMPPETNQLFNCTPASTSVRVTPNHPGPPADSHPPPQTPWGETAAVPQPLDGPGGAVPVRRQEPASRRAHRRRGRGCAGGGAGAGGGTGAAVLGGGGPLPRVPDGRHRLRGPGGASAEPLCPVSPNITTSKSSLVGGQQQSLSPLVTTSLLLFEVLFCPPRVVCYGRRGGG